MTAYEEAAQIVANAKSLYAKARGTVEQRQEIADAVGKLHNEFLAPIDIPGVGTFAETFIDANGDKVLEMVTLALLEKLAKQ